MSLRYVWTVWDKGSTIKKTAVSVPLLLGQWEDTDSTGGASEYYSNSLTSAGKLSSPSSGLFTQSRHKPRGTYWAFNSATGQVYTGGYLGRTDTSSVDTSDYTTHKFYLYDSDGRSSPSYSTPYKVTMATIQGTTQYANVSGYNEADYPENSYSGDYWYVLLGSDTIDPSAVTLTGEVKAGSQVTLTITPSATIAYGGTVTYTVQTTTDGDNWYDAGTTTDTTMTLTVPEAAAWNARVIASDDTGFTSTTAVYANGSEDLVSVINVGFIPKSGWIGYKNTKNLLIVSATGKDGETVNISASLDGTQVITGSTTSGVSYQLALTDEQFAAITEGERHTLTVTAQYATSGTSETRTYTFRKFTYDETSEGGVMEGAARAIREKNGTESTILGSKIPYEIVNGTLGIGDLEQATATAADVMSGKTFYAGDSKEIKTGTASKGLAMTSYSIGNGSSITMPSTWRHFFGISINASGYTNPWAITINKSAVSTPSSNWTVSGNTLTYKNTGFSQTTAKVWIFYNA